MKMIASFQKHAPVTLDRPKVFFNPETSKFVKHFKPYPTHATGDMKGTDVAHVDTATSDQPLGPFKYEGKPAIPWRGEWPRRD
jgi:hypothetical protein